MDDQQTAPPPRKRRASAKAIPETWPANKIEFRKTESLVPYARNARLHSDAQVGMIVASIQKFGWTVPILIDEQDGIIAGHGRVLAASVLEIDVVPVIVARGWTADQKRAYVIADNQLVIAGEWDNDLLRVEISELKAAEFDLGLLGFSLPELEQILWTRPAAVDAEDAPEPPVDPVSRLGDIWLLGHHRIACGDSTDAATVGKALAGARPHLMVTDPPYGVEYDANWRNEAARTSKDMGNRAIGAGAVGKVLNDDRSDWREAWALFPGDVAYVWHAGSHASAVFDSLVSVGLEIRSQIIWAKQQFAIGRGHYHYQHEPCWYAVRKGGTGHWAGDRKQTTLWQIDKPQKSETGHSTQKPIECMKRPIENNSNPGDVIYEPFAGSGTTIVAGEMTKRRVIALELNPAYVDVCVLRWQAITGEQAILESTGEPFDAVKGGRQKSPEPEAQGLPVA